MPVTHWLYPTNDKSDYYLIGADGRAGEVSPERLSALLEQEPNRTDAWVLHTGYRQMRFGDAVWIYAAGAAHQYIYAVARAVDIYRMSDGLWQVDLIWDVKNTRRLRASPIPRSAFQQIPQQAAIRADESTEAVLTTWLRHRGIKLADLEEGAEAESEEDTRQRTLASVVRRQGQQRFRELLLKAYSKRCAITGVSTEFVLEAAHIDPYKGEHTNTVRNGLLLRSDLHVLFDLNLIGIDADDRLVVSPLLKDPTYEKMAGKPVRFLPAAAADRPSTQRLARHLKKLRQ